MSQDQIHLKVQAGAGGNGCESFMYRTDRKTVPDGGDGGKGGRVIFKTDHNAPPITRFGFRQHILAESGGHGGSNRCHGKHGKDIEVIVPIGTKIYDRERGLLIRELNEEGDQVVVLEGGRGGVGNAGHKEPTLGEPGPVLEIELVYRIHAEVFIVGLPNTGKTSLLNLMTGAHGKAEHYPFSSIRPEIGVLFFSDYEKITMCDLPSVYSGSLDGRGRGADFLAHLENAKFILYVLDPDSQFAPSYSEGWKVLREQIEQFSPSFLDIPFAVIINKKDQISGQNNPDQSTFKGSEEVFLTSTLNGQGIEQLKDFLKKKFLEDSK